MATATYTVPKTLKASHRDFVKEVGKHLSGYNFRPATGELFFGDGLAARVSYPATTAYTGEDTLWSIVSHASVPAGQLLQELVSIGFDDEACTLTLTTGTETHVCTLEPVSARSHEDRHRVLSAPTIATIPLSKPERDKLKIAKQVRSRDKTLITLNGYILDGTKGENQVQLYGTDRYRLARTHLATSAPIQSTAYIYTHPRVAVLATHARANTLTFSEYSTGVEMVSGDKECMGFFLPNVESPYHPGLHRLFGFGNAKMEMDFELADAPKIAQSLKKLQVARNKPVILHPAQGRISYTPETLEEEVFADVAGLRTANNEHMSVGFNHEYLASLLAFASPGEVVRMRAVQPSKQHLIEIPSVDVELLLMPVRLPEQ